MLNLKKVKIDSKLIIFFVNLNPWHTLYQFNFLSQLSSEQKGIQQKILTDRDTERLPVQIFGYLNGFINNCNFQ